MRSTGPLAYRKLTKSKTYRPDQPARNAQADLGRYFLQAIRPPFFVERGSGVFLFHLLQNFNLSTYLGIGFDRDRPELDCASNRSDLYRPILITNFSPIFLLLNPFLNKPPFLRVCSKSPLKTLREKEKLLVTSNFSFYHSVFYPI